MLFRLQRILSRAGIASRRTAEELIAAGRVTVNGRVATLGQSADPDQDTIAIDGKALQAPSSAPTWIVLHKPTGVMTTRSDPEGRTTVFDLVDDVPGLTYVGRLDYMTEGLLLLTTDGEAANALTHPSAGTERTYLAVVRGDAMGAARIARRGVELEDGLVKPTRVEVRPLSERRLYEFEVTIAEGKNREIRRLCEALGLTVERLVRLQFGPVRLGRLPVGETRRLTQKETALIGALTRSFVKARKGGVPADIPQERRSKQGVEDPSASRRGTSRKTSRKSSGVAPFGQAGRARMTHSTTDTHGRHSTRSVSRRRSR